METQKVITFDGSEGHRAAARWAVADYLKEQSRWRRWTAEEYPEDKGNDVSADGLARAAEWVEGLDLNHPFIERMLQAAPYEGDTWVTEDAARIASRYCFDVPTEDVDAFLDRFADALESTPVDHEAIRADWWDEPGRYYFDQALGYYFDQALEELGLSGEDLEAIAPEHERQTPRGVYPTIDKVYDLAWDLRKADEDEGGA